MGETSNTLVGVVLKLCDTALVLLLEVEDFNLFRLASGGGEDEFELSLALDDTVFGSVLVAECVTPDDDGLLPAGYETRNARDDDRFTEDSAAAERSVSPIALLPNFFWTCKLTVRF